MVEAQMIDNLLTRGIVNIIPKTNDLRKKLESGEALNVYMGIDPTATRIHIGHAVGLRKLQEFVDLGHNVTFLIGDFTALIGDSSDKDSERPILTPEEIAKNFETYKRQAEKILDFSKVTVRHNSEWLSKLKFSQVLELLQHFSVGDFVSRELIRDRLQNGKRVGLHETIYPVMQGYDSMHLDTDIQIGGADQTFNMQAGRTLIKSYKNKESAVLVTGYVEGTDGRKMSKSWGNAIWLEDSPNDIYGKVMSLRDELIPNYLMLATSLPKDRVQIISELAKNEPMEAKKALAHQITKELHSVENADLAQRHFENVFQKQTSFDSVEEIAVLPGKINIVELLTQTGLVSSRSEAKRLIKDGAIEFNQIQIDDPTSDVEINQSGSIMKVGKKTVTRIIAK